VTQLLSGVNRAVFCGQLHVSSVYVIHIGMTIRTLLRRPTYTVW